MHNTDFSELREMWQSMSGGSVAVEVFMAAAVIVAVVGFGYLVARTVGTFLGRW